MTKIQGAKMDMKRTLGFALTAFLFTAVPYALAAIGAQWNQDSISTSALTCSNPKHTVTSVGVTAVNLPTSNLSNRRVVTFCNSNENTGSPLVKIRIDGVTPVMGSTNAGDVLAQGACINYNIGPDKTAQAIANAGSTAVTALECD